MLKIGCLHNYLTKDYTTVKSSDNIVISGVEQCMPLRTFLERAEVSSSCSVTMWRVEVSPRPLTMLNVTCHLYEHGGCALWLLILFPLPAALLQCGLTFVGYRVSRSLQDKNKCWRGGGGSIDVLSVVYYPNTWLKLSKSWDVLSFPSQLFHC